MSNQFPVLAPSILAADFSRLGEEIEICMNEGIEWIHCDIMDGHFVPNISYGPDIVEVAAHSKAFLDVHLMIENPDQYIEQFVQAGAQLISVHQEACPHLHRTIQHIKDVDVQAGVAVNPATPTELLHPILNEIDLVLVMSVNPGFGGQQFIEATYQKVEKLDKIRQREGYNFKIEVDGGVGLENIQKLAATGVDVFVAGSSVFKADNTAERLHELMDRADKGA